MPDTQTNPAADPAPTAQDPSPDSVGTLDLSQKVKVDGSDMTVQELVSSHEKRKGLEKFREQAGILMQGPSYDPQSYESAVRYVMSDQGWSPAQIDEYVEMQRNPTPSGESDMPPQDHEPAQPAADPALDDEYDGRFDEQEEQNLRIQERLDRVEVDGLRTALNESLDRVLDSDPHIGKMLTKAKELGGADSDPKRRELLRKEIADATLQRMRSRRSREGHLDRNWFREESQKAAESVAERYRTVIGDPDLLMRVPETAAGQDSLRKPEPVVIPKHEIGRSPSDGMAIAKKYTKDSLLELAAEVATGTKTKV